MASAARKPEPESKAEIALSAGLLAKALKSAASIVMSSVTVPILANVRLFADGDTLEITTSDLDTEFRQQIALPAPGHLATTVDARRLSALAGAVDAGATMTLALSEGRLTVKAGRSRWVLPVLPAEDFPVMPFESGSATMEIGGAELARAFSRTLPVVGSDISKIWYLGVSLHPVDGKAALAACDGVALLRSIVGCQWPAGCEPALVPTKLAQTIERLCSDLGRPITLEWDKRKLRARIDDVTVTGKLIDSPFPDYRKLFPEGEVPGLVVDPRDLLTAARRVGLIADKTTRCVRMDRGPESVTLSLASFDTGEGHEEVPANCEAQFSTGFNGMELEKVMNAIGGESLEIIQIDARSPALFRRVVDDGSIGVISPMNL